MNIPQLNHMQQMAVGEALDDIINHRECNPLTVIHGPPGNGKNPYFSYIDLYLYSAGGVLGHWRTPMLRQIIWFEH